MKISCGILAYKIVNNQLQVFLVHPGGPIFARKDNGYWGISKGEVNKEEEFIDCAIREFKEETSVDFSSRKKDLVSLGQIIQKNGKTVHAWAIRDDLESIVDTKGYADLSKISNTVKINLGFKTFESPEIDKGMFFTVEDALLKMNEKQSEFVTRLQKLAE